MIIPQDIIIKAIDNLKDTLARIPEGNGMNALVDDEIRRLMKQKFPDATVTDQDIDIAIRMIAADYKGGKMSPATGSRNLLAQVRNPHGMTVEQLEQRVAQCAGFVKMMTGVANNAAIAIARDCHDKLRKHPKYKHKVKQLFKTAIIDEYRHYRCNLKHPRPDMICFFNLSDMPESARKKYGAVTNDQYFEFWEGTGVLAYQKSQPLIGSLWNKFRLSMMRIGVSHPEIVAWGCVGASVLELSLFVWERVMRSTYEALDGVLTMDQVERIYRPFKMERVSLAWRKALQELAPELNHYTVDEAEERNVALGVEQLSQLWISTDLPFDATIAAVKDFADDIFSTKGHAKKAMAELKQMRNDAVRELEEQIKDK
jgi:hypothetical protein